MSGADDMAALVAEFATLGEADRRAILARLRFDERLRFEAARSGNAGESYSPDIAALAATGGAGLTEAARTALTTALAAGPAVLPAVVRPSLFDRLLRR